MTAMFPWQRFHSAHTVLISKVVTVTVICVCVCAAPCAYYSLSNCPSVLLSPFLSSQFRGSAEGMYEKQKFSSLLSGETGNSQPFITAGDLPAQTCAEDPQIPPAPPGTTSNTAFTTPNVLCNYRRFSKQCIQLNSFSWHSLCGSSHRNCSIRFAPYLHFCATKYNTFVFRSQLQVPHWIPDAVLHNMEAGN